MSSPHRPQDLPEHPVSAAEWARLSGELAAVARRVTLVEDRGEDHAGALDSHEATLSAIVELLAALQPPPPPIGADPDGPEPDPEDQPPNEYDGLDMRRLVAWVRDNVALLVERKIPQIGGAPFWCRQWWMHPEAIARFEAARRSWAEAVSAGEGNAMVVYFEHLDAMLGVLCAENGPFCGCRGEHSSGSAARPLGQDDPAEDYFLEFEHDLDTD